jgi:hypothetical protein
MWLILDEVIEGGWWLDMTTVHDQETINDRKKAAIIKALQRLIEQVEADGCYGEFGVMFSCQNGKIGHYEEHAKRSFK